MKDTFIYSFEWWKQIHRERTEVLLQEDLKEYQYSHYAKVGITLGEEDGIFIMLRNISGTLHEANKIFYNLLCDGFIFNVRIERRRTSILNLLILTLLKQYFQGS